MFDPHVWLDRRVLITGHTGFKGAWLSTWLGCLGAKVSGFALPPKTDPNLYSILTPSLENEAIGDLREPDRIREFVSDVKPEIVFHLAAQSIVRDAYRAPVDTYATNVMGTVNLLEALRSAESVKAILVATTDKVYENDERGRAFCEDDPLGGHDPYSASKACTEILTASYRRSFFDNISGARLSTARSGNVVGGGDWSSDRIVCDVVSAVDNGVPVELRNPNAVRPWLHVLEPLCGYMAFADRLTRPDPAPTALNFAPREGDVKTVAEVVDAFGQVFDGKPGWVHDNAQHPAEATLLTLSPRAAEQTLGWTQQLDFTETIRWTASWYADYRSSKNMRDVTIQQITDYQKRFWDRDAQQRALEFGR
ncbi:MAG: CDP-glucose 4,6-dehydratase [Pseudomonadota bacterium]